MDNNYIPWIEKYKPKTFEDFCFHKQNKKSIIKNINNFPNAIFYGPAGTGKTTVTNIISGNIIKDVKNNCLFMNASDEKNISDIRNKIIGFCSRLPVGEDKKKMLIMDEADAITYDAQAALRKIIEKYDNIIFCFICNYVDKIINPLRSRCI